MASSSKQILPKSESPEPVEPVGDFWPIEGILAENKTKYKIRWKGIDPATNKPWPEEWVKKKDVTEDVVEEWNDLPEEERQRRNELEKPKHSRSKASNKSKGSKRASKSTSKSRASGSTVSTAVSSKKRANRDLGGSISSHEPVSKKATVASLVNRGKKRSIDGFLSDSSDLPEVGTIFNRPRQVERSRKKRKIDYDDVSPSPPVPEVLQQDVSEDSEVEVVAAVVSPVDEKPPKNKLKKDRRPDNAKTAKKKSWAESEESEEVEKDGHTAASNLSLPKAAKTITKRTTTISSPRAVESEDGGHSEPPKLPFDKVGPPKKAKRQNVADIAGPSKTHKRRTNGKVGQPKKPSPPILSPAAERRLYQFDTEMQALEEELQEQTEQSEVTSTRPASFAYGESDMDSEVADVMYPPEEGETWSPRRKGKGKAKVVDDEDDEDDEVPETQSLQPHALTSTPSRSSLIAKMKPRTPHLAAGSKLSVVDVDFDIRPRDLFPEAGASLKPNGVTRKPKTLQPIPVISPSKFAPHLPSSLNDSSIETPDTSQQRPTSSAEQIELFDSPEKPTRARIIAARSTSKEKRTPREQDVAAEYWSENGILATGISSKDVQTRGQELAEKARVTRLQEMGLSGTKRPRIPLEDIQRRSRSASASAQEEFHPITQSPIRSLSREHSGGPASSPPAPDVDEEPEEEDGLEYVDEPEAPMMEIEDSFEEQPIVTVTEDTQMEEEDEGEVMANAPPIQAIPEEGEESTQDLLQELDVEKAISQRGSRSLSPLQKPISQDQEMVHDVSIIPQPGTQHRDQSLEVEHSPPPPLPTRPRAISKVASDSSVKRGRPQPQEDSQEIPATASSNQNSSQDVNQSQDSMSVNGPKDLKAAMSLLNVKSEEIARLEKFLAAERLKVEALSKQVETLRSDLLQSESKASQVLDNTDLAAQLRTELEESKAAHEADRAKWESEKFGLEIAIKSMTERKALAERDCSSFRDEYMKASGLNGLLQTEKKELEKELEIARRQATEGRAAIHAMFDQRVKTLQKDRDDWQRMADFLMDKDHRTNDAIRKKAAEEPELRAKCHRYKEKINGLQEKVLQIEEALTQKDREVQVLEGDLAEERRDNESLRAKLDESEGRSSGSSSQSQASNNSNHQHTPSSPASIPHSIQQLNGRKVAPPFSTLKSQNPDSQDPDAEVYRCTWRVLEGGGFCNLLFASRDELESHMISSGHLAVPADMDSLD